MAESKGIQEVVEQAAIQATTAVIMALKGMDIDPNTKHERTTVAEAWWTGPRKPSFNLSTQDSCVDLLNFEMGGNEHCRDKGIWAY